VITSRGRFGVKLGLDRTRAILERAGNPQLGLRGALVAGTNGKGSTAAMLAAILHQAGHTVGTMPSPHLSSYTERIQVDGVPISEAEFASAVEWLLPRIEDIDRELGPPTEFELLTTIALTYLARHCDRLVVEVGLGGRLDSTNVLDLGVAVITNVDLDHQQHLGDTIEKIAYEKAGVIKAGNTVVTGASPRAMVAIGARAAEVGARVWRLHGEIHHARRTLGWEGVEVDVKWPGFSCSVRTPLLGRFQGDNAALAIAAAHLIDGVDCEAMQTGLAAVSWPGRLEHVGDHPAVLLDGGHNPAAIRWLAQTIPELAEGRRLVIVFGMMADKDLPAALAELHQLRPAEVVFTSAESPRAAAPEHLAELWGGGEVIASPELAVWRGIELAGLEGMLLVCGSLYLVGAVRPMLIAARR
jgi:dihydrofolate synthase / folylpolyglutamate synthase